MQREREERKGFFGMGDPFFNFQGLGRLFGGRDPFDDPFFSRPFGSMLESSRFQPPSSASGDPFHANTAKGVVIEELVSDDEGERDGIHTMDEKDNHQKSTDSSKEPTVEHPDDDPDEMKSKNVNQRSDYNWTSGTEPQTQSVSFCKVTYGGIDGAYYSSTRTRKTGSDGAVIEESKEANKTTGRATHRISRGIHDKGHSVTRKLNSDGKVDMVQTLHNLEEDELAGFEKAWNGNVRERQLPGWRDQFDMHGTAGSSGSERKGMTAWGGRIVPPIDQPRYAGANSSSGGRTKKVVKINIE